MSLPTDLPHEVAERVPQPGFDVVLDRARAGRRRRRTTIASGLAAAAVVGGLAAWGTGLRASDPPDPAGPSPTRTQGSGTPDARLPGEVRDLLGSDQLHPWQVVGSGGGTAAVWGDCSEEDCRFALVTRLGDQVSGSMLRGGAPSIAEVPGGWLVQDDSGLARVSADGDRGPIVDPGRDVVPVEAGDVVVPTRDGLRLLRGFTLLPVPTPDGSEAIGAYATPAGDLVVAWRSGPGAIEVSWTDSTGAWHVGHRSSPATGSVAAVAMAGHHDAVSLVLLGDAPDGSVPVLDVIASQDAGRTWQGAQAVAGLADLSGLAVSDEGSTYLTTGSHGAVRVDAAGGVTSVRQSGHDHSVFQVSHRICVVAEAGRVDQLRCSADDGATWVPQPLPGFG
jgi:hypothetical protein